MSNHNPYLDDVGPLSLPKEEVVPQGKLGGDDIIIHKANLDNVKEDLSHMIPHLSEEPRQKAHEVKKAIDDWDEYLDKRFGKSERK